MSLGGHCSHERCRYIGARKCLWLWWQPTRGELHPWYRHGSATFLCRNPHYFLIYEGPQPLNLAASPFCPRLVLQPRLYPQQFGSPNSRPREYRLTWKPSKRSWGADSWAQISHLNDCVCLCFILSMLNGTIFELIILWYPVYRCWVAFLLHDLNKLRIWSSKPWQKKS